MRTWPRKIFAFFLALSFLFPTTLSIQSSQADGALFADRIDLFFDPEFPLPPGETLLTYYQGKKYRFMYREIIPTEVGGHTYFAILGANGGYPDFYGGIQHFKDGTKAAIFSAWDVGANGACGTCLPGTAPAAKQVSVWAKGSRTVTRPFGYEGTGMNSMIYGFDWKLGQKVAMLASIEPSGNGSLISAAIKNGDDAWEFMTSFYVPTRYDMGMPGGYSFLEDWVGESEITRSFLVGPSYLEDGNGVGAYFTNVYAYSSNISGAKIPNRHSISIEGSWLRVRSGIPLQASYSVEKRLQLIKPTTFPDISKGKELLERIVDGKSTRSAELKAKQEAEAKAAAELKAKQEADAKAAAELKAKQEAEAKAIADAAAQRVIQDDFNAVTSSYQKLLLRIYDLKIKFPRVSNLLGTEEKLLRLPIILGSDLSTAKYNIQSVNASLDTSEKVWEKTQKTTITCVKGKLTKKVTAVKPKCPTGFKVKK